jgi:putative FmdB family regulatory protein
VSVDTMPIYEYRCQACGHAFELLVLKTTAVACPSCRSEALERLLSLPAIKSDSTHARALDAAKARDRKQGDEKARAQREYELSHDD